MSTERTEEQKIKQACEDWVRTFNAIDTRMLADVNAAHDYNDIREITLPSKYDRVYVFDKGEYGEIVDVKNEKYYVELDDDDETLELNGDDFELADYGELPMWGTMWSFENIIDDDWLSGEFVDEGKPSGLRALSDCGFRIYESEEYGYFFGIDGAGYDFFSEHWIPLYKARGLEWHKYL